jgi:hypothetical protein
MFSIMSNFEEQEDCNSPDDKDLKNLLFLHHAANTLHEKE